MRDWTLARALGALGEARPAWARWRRYAPVAVLIGTFFAFLGPFGTSSWGWPLVWIYWTGTMLAGWTFASFLIGAVMRALPRAWPAWAHVLAVALALTPPMSVIVILSLMAIGFPPSLARGAATVFDVFVVSLAMSTIGLAFERRLRFGPARPASAAAGEAAGAALRERLPARLRTAPILAIAAEDHYLRVHTSAGSELILMRLSDAIRAVADLDGLQTHRSWWVARDAVAEVERVNGKMTLKLTNGLAAPVSRSFAARVREAGWG